MEERGSEGCTAKTMWGGLGGRRRRGGEGMPFTCSTGLAFRCPHASCEKRCLSTPPFFFISSLPPHSTPQFQPSSDSPGEVRFAFWVCFLLRFLIFRFFSFCVGHARGGNREACFWEACLEWVRVFGRHAWEWVRVERGSTCHLANRKGVHKANSMMGIFCFKP